MPREGHLHATLRMFGYLKAFSKAKLVFDPRSLVVLTKREKVEYGWTELYPNATEEFPPNMFEPLMTPIQITAFYDVSHASFLITRRSVTGIVLILNNTILRCISKRQNTVEGSTYGSEMVAGRLAAK